MKKSILVPALWVLSQSVLYAGPYSENFDTGMDHYQAEHFTEAAAFFQTAVESADTVSRRVEALLFAGHSLYHSGDYHAANDMYEKVITLEDAPANARAVALLQTGYGLLYAGEVTAAQERHNEILKLTGVNATYIEEVKRGWDDHIFGKASEAFEERAFDRALDWAEKARGLAPDAYRKGQALLKIARSHDQMGNQDAAKDYFARVLEHEAELPGDLSMEALLNIGNSYFNTENYAKAREYYRRGLELREQFFAAHRENIEYPGFDIIMGSRDYYQYIQMYDRLVRHWENAWIRWGDSYREEGNHESALGAYEELAGMTFVNPPTRAHAYLRAGKLYEERGEYQKAVDRFQSARQMRTPRQLADRILSELKRVQAKLDP